MFLCSKMNAEGFDLATLNGGKRLLKQGKKALRLH